MARVVAVVSDLLLGSRVEEALRAAGHDVTLSPSLQGAELDGVELLVADLELENPEALVGLGAPVLGFYSHVDAETRRIAEAAGVDLAVPRSRMSRELPQLAERLLSADGGAGAGV